MYATASTTSNVLINMSGHPTVSMDVSSSGDFSYKPLPGLNISAALVRGNGQATCFFWRDVSRGSRPPGSSYISLPFSNEFPLVFGFELADRVYCYDNTFNADGNTFTLFLEYADGQQKLLRLTMDNDLDGYAEMKLGPGAEVESPVRAALVGVPASSDTTTTRRRGFFRSHSVCYFVLRGRRLTRLAYVTYANTKTNLSLPLDDEEEDYESVVCFRDYSDREAQRQWYTGEPLT